MIIILCKQIQLLLNTGTSCPSDSLFITEENINPLLGNWCCHHELNCPVTNRPNAYCWSAARHISHWKQNTHFQLRIIVCFFLFCIIFILSLSLLIPGGVQTFFFVFYFGEEGIQQWRRAPCPAEGVKSKAINERSVHLFGLVRITGTLAKWKKISHLYQSPYFTRRVRVPWKLVRQTRKFSLFHLFCCARRFFFFPKHISEILGNKQQTLHFFALALDYLSPFSKGSSEIRGFYFFRPQGLFHF